MLDVDAAEYAGRTEPGVLAVFLDRFLDLDRELARRGENQRAYRMTGGRRAAARMRRETLQDRQCKAGGFTGAGLRAAHDVAAGKYERNGLLLDGCWDGVAGFGDGPQQFGPQAELDEARCVQIKLL